MVPDNDPKKTRIRVRIPSRQRREAPAVASDEASASPPAASVEPSESAAPPPAPFELSASLRRKGSPSPSVPASGSRGMDPMLASRVSRSQGDDRARRLTFELENGELPNVLQFLSTDKRTGKLELTVQNQPNAGYVFFEAGEVYLARYRDFDGVEALAQVVNTGRIRAVFINGAKSAERNIDVPVSSLLLEVLVRADELAAEMDAKPPAPVSKSAASRLPPPPKPELTVPDATVRKRGVVVHGTAKRPSVSAPKKQGPSFFGRLAIRVVELVILAILLCGAYLAYERFARMSGGRLFSFGQKSDAEPSDQSDLELDLMNTWLKSAETAIASQQYGEAADLIDRILTLEPDNAQALGLREIIDRENAPVAARRLAETAAEKLAEIAGFKAAVWAAESAARAEGLNRSARRLLEEKQYPGAVKAFRAVIAEADALLDKQRLFREAMNRKKLVAQAKAKAQTTGSIDQAGGLLSEASTAEEEAESLFAAHSFAAAAKSWEKARGFYERSASYATTVGDVARLARGFKVLQAACEGIENIPEAAALARQAAVIATEAERLGTEGDILRARMKWQEALETLRRASSLANIAGKQEQYKGYMAKGAAAAEEEDWAAARAAFTAALGVPGYADDAEALRGIFQADKGLLAREMKTAANQARWQEAKVAAEELLNIDPGNKDAAEIILQAQNNLIVNLKIQAVFEGQPVAGARAIVGGEPETRLLPYTAGLPLDRNYHIRVWAPPKGNTYFQTYTTVYEARKVGPDTLTVNLHASGGPEKTKSWRIPGIVLDMEYIRPGTFAMGSERRKDEQPIREVTITSHFWMGTAEVTNQQYRDFLAETGYNGERSANSGYLRHFSGSSAMSDAGEYPICYVSWKNAMAFCEWLTNRERNGNRLPENFVYRLPTEAEWEYCASAGGKSEYLDLDGRGWYLKNSHANQPIQQLRANSFGLYDMLGNVWELCYDYYGRYPQQDEVDPVGPKRGVLRVMRGGSHANPADLCRVSYRSSIGWTDARANTGFRIVLAPPIEDLQKSGRSESAVQTGDED